MKFLSIPFFLLGTVFFLLVSLSGASPQPRPVIDRLEFTKISDQLEVPEDIIVDMVEDQNGILWALTNETLFRFDGYGFKGFPTLPEEETDRRSVVTQNLLMDQNNHIWVGRGRWLSRFNLTTHKFTHFLFEVENHYSAIMGIQQDKNGDLHVLTGGGWLYRFIPETASFHQECRIEEMASFFSFLIDSRNRFWGGSDGSLYKYNLESGSGEMVLRQDPRNPTERCSFNAIIEDKNSNIVIGSWQKEFIIFNPETHQKTVFENSGAINDAQVDQEGNLYFGSTAGLSVYNPNKDLIYVYSHDQKNNHSIPPGNNWSVFIDSSNNLWLGTSRSGLIVAYANTGFVNLHVSQNWLPKVPRKNNVSAILEDSLGRLWLGYHNDGFEMLDNRRNDSWYADFNSRGSEYFKVGSVYKFLENPIGLIHTSSASGGLIGINPDRREIIHINHDPDDFNTPGGSDIRDMAVDRKNRLWLMFHYGKLDVYVPETGTFRHIVSDRKPIIPNQKLWFNDILLDSEERIWLGTSAGLFVFIDEKLDSEFLLGLPFSGFENDQAVNCMLQSRPDDFWIGTATGLYRWNIESGAIRKFTTANGLGSNEIRSLNMVKDNNIWVATAKGLTNLDITLGTGINYTTADGLPGNVYYRGATFRNQSGELYFGSKQGVTKFHPDNIQSHHTPPNVFITKFLLNNDEVPVSDDSSENAILTKTIEETKEIVLPYGPYTITFEYSAISYKNASQNKYSYKLEGFNEEWSEARNRRDCTYTNLNPGDYTFRVRVQNYQGFWNEEGAELKITILPPFWQRWWFRALLIILFLILLSLTYYIRVRAIMAHRKQLQNEVALQTVQLREAIEESKSQQIQITDQNQLLLQHQQTLEHRIEERTRELKEAKVKAEESDRIKSAFLRNISHEFRTPMNAIIGGVAVICHSKSDPLNRDHFANMMMRSCDVLVKLIDDIIDLSRMDAGELPIHKTKTDINELMDIVYQQNKELFKLDPASNVGFILEKNTSESPESFKTDGKRLIQILGYLIENAAKFTSQGSVTLGYRIEKNRNISFYVSDTGVGISQDQIKHVFDRFTKFYNEDYFHQGSGLGLTIGKKLTESMGGKIRINSKLHEGTVITLEFPFF